MEQKMSRRLPRAVLRRRGRQDDCGDEETIVRKRAIVFAGFAARMGNVRLPKRVAFGEVEGAKGYSGGKERDWTSCPNLSLFQVVHPCRALDAGAINREMVANVSRKKQKSA